MPSEFCPHNLSDVYSHPPFIVAESSEFSGAFSIICAFNDSSGDSNFWATNTNTGWLTIDTGPSSRTTITSYAIKMNGLSQPNRAPKDFTLQGSLDGASWTTIDTRTNETGWTNDEVRTFTLGSTSSPYRHFKLNITANNGDSLCQVREFYLTGTYNLATELLVNSMVSNTSPSPLVASASSEFGGSWEAWHAFDGVGVGGLGWVSASGGSSWWLKLDFGSGYTVRGYTMTCRTGEPNRAPKDWTFEGSNDGSSWTTLDTQSSQTGWSTVYSRNFEIASPASYRYYRVNISANNSDSLTGIAELMLFGITVSSSPAFSFCMFMG